MTIKNTKKNISAEPEDVVIDVSANTPSKAKKTSNVIADNNAENKNYSQDMTITFTLHDFSNDENESTTKTVTVPLSELVRLGHLEANYYNKSNSYSKTEIDNKIKMHFEVWPNSTPPTLAQVKAKENYENYIFLVPYSSNVQGNDTYQEGGYREYVYVKDSNNNESVEQIGSLQLDLTGFLKTANLDTALTGLVNASGTSGYKTLKTTVDELSTSVTNLQNDKADKEQSTANAFVITDSSKKISTSAKVGNIDTSGKLYNGSSVLANKILTSNASGVIIGSDSLDSSKIINAAALNSKLGLSQNTAQSVINSTIDSTLNTLYTTDLPLYLKINDIKTQIWGSSGFASEQNGLASNHAHKNDKLGDYIYYHLYDKFYSKTQIDSMIASIESLQRQTLNIL